MFGLGGSSSLLIARGTIVPPPSLLVTLDQAVQVELEQRYHTTRDAETRTATRWSCYAPRA